MQLISYIKWVLMIIGASRGNLVGAVVGYTVGYFLEEFLKNNLTIETKNIFNETEYKYTPYQESLLALISEVVKADGYIHKEEIYFIKNFLLKQFGSIYSNKMLKSLKLNIDKNFNVEDICLDLKHSLDHAIKIQMLTFLYGIALQNKSISKKEQFLIERIGKIIGLSLAEYQNIVSQFSNQRTEKKRPTASKVYGYSAYKILGITASADNKEIKKAYRKMVLKYHPDRTDLDDSIANEKFSEISKAYHIIKQERNIK
jgi:DnaJ like chaperone protein